METHPRSVMRGSMLAGFGRGGRRIPGGTASNGLMMTRRLANGDRVSMMTRLVVESELVQPPRQLVESSWRHRSEEHTSELQSRLHLVCRLLLEKKKKTKT